MLGIGAEMKIAVVTSLLAKGDMDVDSAHFSVGSRQLARIGQRPGRVCSLQWFINPHQGDVSIEILN